MLPGAAAGSTKAFTSLACMYDPGSLKGWCLGGGLHASSTPVIALLLLIATPGTCDTSQTQAQTKANATVWDSTNQWAPASNPWYVQKFQRNAEAWSPRQTIPLLPTIIIEKYKLFTNTCMLYRQTCSRSRDNQYGTGWR